MAEGLGVAVDGRRGYVTIALDEPGIEEDLRSEHVRLGYSEIKIERVSRHEAVVGFETYAKDRAHA